MDGHPRTNNSVEWFHNSLQGSVNTHNPTICKIISRFETEESLSRKKKADATNGMQLDKKNYQNVNAKFHSNVINFSLSSSQECLNKHCSLHAFFLNCNVDISCGVVMNVFIL